MAKLPAEIGKYKIVSLIARGGMGAVYKAVHPTLKRFVVLKKLTIRGDAAMSQRFKREASIMMDLRNEHIVQVYDHFKAGSSYYIVSEFVDGISLETLIEQVPHLPVDVALWIFLDCCRALQYAHDRQIIHRDIKPANILLSKKGEVKLTDFGIAVMKGEDESSLTREGTTLGTPSYMPPEQFESTRAVDNRADIYSLGVTLYEMATGMKPFPGSFSPKLLALIQKGRYTRPRKINPKIPPMVSRLIRQCMRVNPERRYQNLKIPSRPILTLLRRLKPSVVKKRLVAFVSGREVSDLPKRTSPLTKVLFAGAAFLILLLGSIGYYLYDQGLHYELIWPRSHGSLTVTAKIRKGFKDPEKTFIDATIYSEGSHDSLEDSFEVVPIRIHFKPSRERETEDFYFLESKSIYLRADRYRLVVNLENQLFWDTFFLRPRTLQKQREATRRGRKIEVTLDELPPLPLTVNYKITDQASGADITDGTELSVRKGDLWYSWNKFIARSLTSNNVYRFRFTRSGYYTQEYDIRAAPYQSLLDIHVNLVAEPGLLRIISDTEGLRLLLNDSPDYLTGGREPVWERFEPSEKGTFEVQIQPGEYTFTVIRSPSVSKSIKFTIQTGETREIRLRYLPEKKSISLIVVG